MPQTQINCPNCRQPVSADIQQLFDMNTDPTAKQRLLSGGFNMIQCPHCGFQGMANTTIVYHDPEKEFLLTYFPVDVGHPVHAQEKHIGPLINKVTNDLPIEKRKGYLLQPQTMLTLQTMLEKILEADGITKGMIEAQQKQFELIQRLLRASPEDRKQIIIQEEDSIDESMFAIISRLAEGSMAQGDQETGKTLAELQTQLLEQTKVGREIQSQVNDSQAAIKTLENASKDGLTRESLLDIIIKSPSDTYLETIINMAYSGLDYTFFQMLTERIDNSSGDDKNKLVELREMILDKTQEIEKAIQEQTKLAKDLIEKILSETDVEDATQKNLNNINDLFISLVKSELDAARKNDDLERGAKLQTINNVIKAAMAPPAEIAVIEELLSIEDNDERKKKIETDVEKITPEFLQVLNSLMVQFEQQGQNPEITNRLSEIYRTALRVSMKANLGK